MPLASLRRLAVQVVLSVPTRLARDRYANASLILLAALNPYSPFHKTVILPRMFSVCMPEEARAVMPDDWYLA
jgi:hypothetical protein